MNKYTLLLITILSILLKYFFHQQKHKLNAFNTYQLFLEFHHILKKILLFQIKLFSFSVASSQNSSIYQYLEIEFSGASIQINLAFMISFHFLKCKVSPSIIFTTSKNQASFSISEIILKTSDIKK